MKRPLIFLFFIVAIGCITFSFNVFKQSDAYQLDYITRITAFKQMQEQLIAKVQHSNLEHETDIASIKQAIIETRNNLKGVDFWLRYLEPLSYKKINGPLPIEWETEVFEKFEKPYRREGAGYTLALQHLDEDHVNKDYLLDLLQQSLQATKTFYADSITTLLSSYHHFYLCNRLFLLNLATIYTSGFDCPQPSRVIPELNMMLLQVERIYQLYNESYPKVALHTAYLQLYKQALQFAESQPTDYTLFDHFTFIRDYVNPLFALNQQMIVKYQVASKSMVDYSLNKQASSIFSKDLYRGQNPKGVFLRVTDEKDLAEIDRLGKLLFFDPILSGNNQRSCASCHNPNSFFTDTVSPTALEFNHNGFLARNTPSLLNAQYNHLIMADGKHISLQDQTIGVITNNAEMGNTEKELVTKVMSCKEYNKLLTYLLKYTPQEKEINATHIASAITYYYSKFSKYTAPFDEAMNKKQELSSNAVLGFNLFMGKAQCGTCHFAPQFNGVKPPYVGSEFEVLGVPEDTNYSLISNDKGRYNINPANETLNAFRTGTIRNSAATKPYMHNGVFKSLSEVIDFYNAGGGAGRGLNVPNQTLSSDSLHLTSIEKQYLLDFIASLNEQVVFENPPAKLPLSANKNWNNRTIGGIY